MRSETNSQSVQLQIYDFIVLDTCLKKDLLRLDPYLLGMKNLSMQ